MKYEDMIPEIIELDEEAYKEFRRLLNAPPKNIDSLKKFLESKSPWDDENNE